MSIIETVDVGASLQKQLHRGDMAPERRLAQAIVKVRYAGNPCEQHADCRRVAPRQRQHHRRVAIARLGIDIGAPLQQGFDRFELPVVDCQHQRGVSLAAPGVDMRARIQQAGHDVKMPARGGKHQQGIRASRERATLTREGNQLVQHGGAIGMSGHGLLQSLQVICLDSLAQDRQAGGG